MGGNFVAGLLFEGSKSNSRDFTTAFSTTPASYTIGRELDYALSLRAQAGYTPGGGALFYVTGGGSFAEIKHSFATTNAANSFAEVNDNKMKFGYQGTNLPDFKASATWSSMTKPSPSPGSAAVMIISCR